ncbi:hypothetical protein K474DRAFT_309381 [Panus rudis PR-1116 ss-1]|nr:hypothetical protein K474DRAFT_309381 [Panus rudis PR-1116 ss-1]
MLSHASRLASPPSSTLFSILHFAAGRAWSRTGPRRVFHRGVERRQSQCGESSKQVIGESYHHTLSKQLEPVAKPETHDVDIKLTKELPSTCDAGVDFAARASHQSSHSYSYRGQGTATQAGSLLPATASSRQPSEVSSQNSTIDFTPGQGSSLTYESDPPWAEDVATHELTFPARHTNSIQLVSLLRNAPRTPEELCGNLNHLIRTYPTLPIPQLIEFHDSFWPLQCTSSFNTLLDHCIRRASYGSAHTLLAKMHARRMVLDTHTRQLRVRLLLREGQWFEAWRMENPDTADAEYRLPLPVWVEFFNSFHQGALRERMPVSLPDGSVGYTLRPKVDTTSENDRVAQLRLLMQRPPLSLLGRPKEARLSPSLVRRIVNFLLRMPDRELAEKVTEFYFGQLPHNLDDRCRGICVDIIHSHMVRHTKRGLAGYYRAQDLLHRYFHMHPEFRPNPTTLFILLRYLRSSRDCGSFALRVVRSFVKRWGKSVVDARVLQRLGSLGVKEGRLDIAQIVLDGQEDQDSKVQRLLTTARRMEGPSEAIVLPPYRPPTVSQGRNDERRRWITLRRRFFRRANKRTSEAG